MTILTYEFFLRVAGNLVYFEGRPGLLPRYSPGMGARILPRRRPWASSSISSFRLGGLRDEPKKTSTWEVRGCEAFH